MVTRRPNSATRNVEELPPLPPSERASTCTKSNADSNSIQTPAIPRENPLNGKWVGFYATGGAKSKLSEPATCFAYNIQLICNDDGTITGKTLTRDEDFQFSGSFDGTKVVFEETSTTRFHYPVQFSGSLDKHNANQLSGKWSKIGGGGGDPALSGSMRLQRICSSDPQPIRGIQSGEYYGSVYDETKNLWYYLRFPWLEVLDGVLYGMGVEGMGGIYTVRGVHGNGQVSIYVTQWREKDSVISAYKGMVSRATGSIFGVKVTTLDFGYEDEMIDLEEAFASKSRLEESNIGFRLWRGVDENGTRETGDVGQFRKRFLETRNEGEASILSVGKWEGTWTFGTVEASDLCKWYICFSSEEFISGDGYSNIDGIEEQFVFDGIIDIKRKKVQIYQTFLSSLSLYIYDMQIENNSRITGKGGPNDDASKNPFVLSCVRVSKSNANSNPSIEPLGEKENNPSRDNEKTDTE
ncbi:hypothetical protein BDR26DRAFT_858330 [Obelidium mucronatum]|nr:hypothetical protein BDR26DRAFT_858330 [Obelidium mucronatum]